MLKSNKDFIFEMNSDNEYLPNKKYNDYVYFHIFFMSFFVIK